MTFEESGRVRQLNPAEIAGIAAMDRAYAHAKDQLARAAAARARAYAAVGMDPNRNYNVYSDGRVEEVQEDTNEGEATHLNR